MLPLKAGCYGKNISLMFWRNIMKKKQILSLLLAALMLTASCSSSQDGSSDTTSSASYDSASSDETTDQSILAKFTPELKKELELDGYEFNIFVRPSIDDWTIVDLVSEGETGDVLNDAVYKRNLWLEENYGFKINVGYSSATGTPEIQTYILADDDSYDAYFPIGRVAAGLATQGLLYDLNELEHIDFNKDCWNKMLLDSIAFGGKQYYASGAITTNSYNAVTMMAFNKGMIDKYKLDDPYQLVKDGKWTFDKLHEMASQVADDLNGDSERTSADQFGITLQTTANTIAFFFSSGESVTKMDSDGLPVITLESERAINVYNKLRDSVADHNVYFTGTDPENLAMFSEGRALFYLEVLNTIAKLRTYDLEFGLLPLPKWTEDQEQYIQWVNGWCLCPIVVANNNANPDRTGFMIQALAEASQDFLIAPYYTKVLEGKIASDQESADMLDIAINNFVLDNCDMYSWSGITSALVTGLKEGSEISSIIASNKSALEAAIQKTIDALCE